ncbi:MerR family transcriptional regulator [Planomicrobium sp. YIM 101495]|nr:MerR family transcriptional regulator [Planomicrobium sp. YIM 101495]
MYKVQEVAKIAGVSVRTLHHYDSIGLLKPSSIGSNRYRYYNDEDLKSLQQILFLKELGFSLKKIQEAMTGGWDAVKALDINAALLKEKKERIEQLIQHTQLTKQELNGEIELSNEQRFSAFIGNKELPDVSIYETGLPAEAAAEVAPEPAVTPELEVETAPAPAPVKEEEDLEEINREADRIYNAVASLMHLPPDAAEVQSEMKAYYTLLDRFYACSPAMFKGLADLYAGDPRHGSNIERYRTGLAAYLKKAMYVYAESRQHA